MKLNELAEAYKAQRIRKELAELEATKQSKALERIKRQIVDAMMDTGFKTVKTDDGLTLTWTRHVGVSCTKENREQIRGWLVDEFGDDEPFLETVVSKKALEEIVRNRVETDDADAEDFPEFLNVNLHPGISVQGWKQFKKEV